MILARVVGRLWSDRHVDDLTGRRMVIVRDVGGDGLHVAIDLIDVTAGDTVVVTTDEGVRPMLPGVSCDAAVVARVADHDPIPAPDATS